MTVVFDAGQNSTANFEQLRTETVNSAGVVEARSCGGGCGDGGRGVLLTSGGGAGRRRDVDMTIVISGW